MTPSVLSIHECREIEAAVRADEGDGFDFMLTLRAGGYYRDERENDGDAYTALFLAYALYCMSPDFDGNAS